MLLVESVQGHVQCNSSLGNQYIQHTSTVTQVVLKEKFQGTIAICRVWPYHPIWRENKPEPVLLLPVTTPLNEFHHHVPGQENLFILIQRLKLCYGWGILAKKVYHHIGVQQNHPLSLRC